MKLTKRERALLEKAHAALVAVLDAGLVERYDEAVENKHGALAEKSYIPAATHEIQDVLWPPEKGKK